MAPLEEHPESRRLLRAALDAAQDHLRVVHQVRVRLEAHAELDKHVPDACVLELPVGQAVL